MNGTFAAGGAVTIAAGSVKRLRRFDNELGGLAA